MSPLSAKNTCTLIVAILAIWGAFVYKKRQTDEGLKQHLDEVLDGLLRAEKKVELNPDIKVAVGFGSCLDLISEGLEVLDKVGAQPPDDPEHTENIDSLLGLEKIFAYFFRHGAAAERFVDNATLFRALTTAASTLPATEYKLGGNAPVMASRFQAEGAQVLLGAQMSEKLRTQISDEIQVTGETMTEDDIHLLLEYAKGRKWGPYTSPRANRFIFHADVNNPTLSSMELFEEELRLFSPSLLVIGGLQMMDNFPFQQGQREARLRKLSALLAAVPRATNVHFEMASFAEEACLEDVIRHVVFHSDSLGMNEQELPNLHSVLTNGTVTLISDPYPRVATTLDQMRAVWAQLRATDTANGRRPLSRLHVHTLAFQAIMTAKGSAWKNTMSAAAKASLTANRHTCGSDAISTATARIIMDESFSRSRSDANDRVAFDSGRPVSCWDEGDAEICIAPVLVCTNVVQTGGGGDNISSAGLVLQI